MELREVLKMIIRFFKIFTCKIHLFTYMILENLYDYLVLICTYFVNVLKQGYGINFLNAYFDEI